MVRFSSEALQAGIEKHAIDGVPAQIYAPANTVAECFKYLNKMAADAAIEVLRESWRARNCKLEELWRYAAICRSANICFKIINAERPPPAA